MNFGLVSLPPSPLCIEKPIDYQQFAAWTEIICCEYH